MKKTNGGYIQKTKLQLQSFLIPIPKHAYWNGKRLTDSKAIYILETGKQSEWHLNKRTLNEIKHSKLILWTIKNKHKVESSVVLVYKPRVLQTYSNTVSNNLFFF